jgi:hypothetical protein
MPTITVPNAVDIDIYCKMQVFGSDFWCINIVSCIGLKQTFNEHYCIAFSKKSR